jgi:hypothetical protein
VGSAGLPTRASSCNGRRPHLPPTVRRLADRSGRHDRHRRRDRSLGHGRRRRIMTVGWHDRDVKWFADRYGVPLYVPGEPHGAHRPARRSCAWPVAFRSAPCTWCLVVGAGRYAPSKNVRSGGRNTASSSPGIASARRRTSRRRARLGFTRSGVQARPPSLSGYRCVASSRATA